MEGRYKAYPEYKDSGVEYLDSIPKNWNLIAHKLIASFTKGKNPDNLLDIQIKNSFPYLSMDYLRGNEIPKYALKNKNIYLVKENQVLIIWDGSNAGEFINGKTGVLSSTMAAFELKSGIDKKYYWFLCKHIEPQIRTSATGMGIPHVNGHILRNINIPLPRAQEQQKIANFLDYETAKIDKLIAKQERLIELLKEKRQAVISHAVTKGLNPNVKMKDSGVEWLGQVPKHWNEVPLKQLCSYNDEVLSETTLSEIEIEYIDISSVNAVDGITKTEKITFGNAPSRARRVVRDGDVIISTVRTYLEAIAPIKITSPNIIVSTGFAVIRPNKNFYNGFASYCLRAKGFISEVVARSVGISYPAINASELVNIKIPSLPYSEQQKIANFLDYETAKIDKLITKQEKMIELSKERKVALISAVVTGKIDVRDWKLTRETV